MEQIYTEISRLKEVGRLPTQIEIESQIWAKFMTLMSGRAARVQDGPFYEPSIFGLPVKLLEPNSLHSDGWRVVCSEQI
jgi:hypothetical protein